MLFLIIGNLVVTYQLHCASIISLTCFLYTCAICFTFFSMCDQFAVCLFPFISCIIALSNTSFINVAVNCDISFSKSSNGFIRFPFFPMCQGDNAEEAQRRW